MTEEFRQIPDSWKWVKLDDITENIEKVNYRKTPNVFFKYIDISSIDNNVQKIVDYKEYKGKDSPSRARQMIKSNDVLFSTVRTYLKNIAMVEPKFDGEIASTGFCILRPKEPIEPKFIFYYVQTSEFLNPLNNLQRGTSYPAVRNGDVLNQLFPLAPLAEQVRIVGRVEELFSRLDAGMRSLQAAQTQLEQYRLTTLKQAYTGRLTQKWRHENPDNEPSSTLIEHIKKELEKLPTQRFTPKKIKLDNLSELPDKWSWVQMGEVFYIILGQSPPSSTYNEVKKGLPFFQGSKEFRERYPIIQKWCSEPKKIAEKNDVLISVRAPVGDVNIAPEKCCIGRGLSAIRALAGVKPLYVYHLIEFIRSDLESKGTGSTFNAITGDVLRSQIIPLPPLDEIDEIVENIEMSFSIFKRIEKNLDQNIRKCERLKQSILRKAFEGRLVPQDPNDEPASLLLERIKAQKVKQGKLI